jgi:hypothetical protein
MKARETGEALPCYRAGCRSAAGAACDISRLERLSAGRRPHAQAGLGAARADGLQKRADTCRAVSCRRDLVWHRGRNGLQGPQRSFGF